MLTVAVPFADPWEERDYADVWTSLEAGGHEIQWYDVGSSDRAYFDLLASLWARGRTFAICEHDIQIHPTALDELDACPYDWCGFRYEYGTYGLHYGLGCVKFSEALIARNPDAMRRVGVMSDDLHPKKHWCRIDAFLQGVVLPGNGEHMHRHSRAVRHLGHGNSHGCNTN